MPASILLSSDERAAGRPTDTSIASAVELYERDGFVQIDNAFDRDYIGRLHWAYMRFIKDQGLESVIANNLCVGDMRFMVTVDIKDEFADPTVWANPVLLPILQGLLGDAVVLNSYISVLAFPGAEDQKLHYDHPHLYGETPISAQLPPFAVTVHIPLIDLNEEVGTTAAYPGSHRFVTTEDHAYDLANYERPCPAMGSAFLFDYRVWHYGMANRSQMFRPILSIIYSRPWFMDSCNFSRQTPLTLSYDAYMAVPDHLKPMFTRAAVSGAPEGFRPVRAGVLRY